MTDLGSLLADGRLDDRRADLRIGVVTQASPLMVQIGSGTAPAVKLASYSNPIVSEVVVVLVLEGFRVVLGRIGNDFGFNPLEFAAVAAPSNVAVNTSLSFVIPPANGIEFTCKAGDVVKLHYETTYQLGTVTGHVTLGMQGYLLGSPLGLANPLDGMVGVTGQLNMGFHTVTFTVPTDGDWTFTLTAQCTTGSVTYLAGYTAIHAEHFGIR